jgi:hypothetical protein
MTRWSWTLMPVRAPALTTSAVMAMSASDGMALAAREFVADRMVQFERSSAQRPYIVISSVRRLSVPIS